MGFWKTGMGEKRNGGTMNIHSHSKLLSMGFRLLAQGCMCLCAIVAVADDSNKKVFTLTEPTKISGYEDIVFALKMPLKAGKAEQGNFGRKKLPVRGVLALCTWSSDPEDIKTNVTPGGRFPHFSKFAEKHNLALLSWTNFKGYRVNKSGDEMEEDVYKVYDKNFDKRAREWENGFRRVCKKYDLPRENMLIYGLSGGGQMSHRLVLRKPKYFSAIHIHVNSSYDVPTSHANKLLWLVTTGTKEYGYPAGQRFYREALEKGYHMIFKAGENLGHSDSREIQNLSLKYFEYCLKFIPDYTDPDWQAPPTDKFYFMRYPVYIGDYFNQEAFPVKEAKKFVEPKSMVALPTIDIAHAWGTVIE